ncbi:hypothetical protein TREES_T100015032 [Tupaia chinensis]|uniref:Uncharacterized protein n=1 Tax=Tupaia chinensis TaxID=246437 RepID=L9KJI2_TUPCH|nr:hypothetical protein TREES_T100015032 [Tupaia chinensis]
MPTRDSLQSRATGNGRRLTLALAARLGLGTARAAARKPRAAEKGCQTSDAQNPRAEGVGVRDGGPSLAHLPSRLSPAAPQASGEAAPGSWGPGAGGRNVGRHPPWLASPRPALPVWGVPSTSGLHRLSVLPNHTRGVSRAQASRRAPQELAAQSCALSPPSAKYNSSLSFPDSKAAPARNTRIQAPPPAKAAATCSLQGLRKGGVNEAPNDL